MILPRMALAPEQRRRLAVALTLGGETPEQAAELLRVSERSVWRWPGAYRERGEGALATKPGQGRPPKLCDAQARRVLAWVSGHSACDFGFVTDRWTAPRVAALIERSFGGADEPQVPQRLALPPRADHPRADHPAGAGAARRAAERDEGAVRRWVDEQWPTLKKR